MKLETEFMRLLAAVNRLDADWTQRLIKACKSAKSRRYPQNLLYRAAIATITHKLTVGDIDPVATFTSFIAVKRSFKIQLSPDQADWESQLLALVAAYPGKTEERCVEMFSFECAADRSKLYDILRDLIADGRLRLDDRVKYTLVFFPEPPAAPAHPGKKGTTTFCGAAQSHRDLESHPANVYGLSYKAIGRRIASGMKPLEALTTPRRRAE